MSLSPEHIPLTHSLRNCVVERFAPEQAQRDEEALTHENLLAYLAASKDTDTSPLATIKREAARHKRDATLRDEHHAILTWVCEAFSNWEERYPLEGSLHKQIHRLLPLTVAVALEGKHFFTPGEHPMHQFLDTLQNGAVGWQVRLDRAGQIMEQRVERAVEKALEWFGDQRIDIAAITRELVAANERDAARAQRMVQRLAEMEQARLRTLAARRDAALMINAGLEDYELPGAIGEFLKGPWYDSAQLVLVKHGALSAEWEQLQRTTRHLMESVQLSADDTPATRSGREQILRHLPGDLRRWLLSLEHDSEATDSAIGLIEYAHLRLRHGQDLERARIPPIELEEQAQEEEAGGSESLNIGEWYRFGDGEDELRAQLVLQLKAGRHLLFANLVGLKALDLSRQAFQRRLNEGAARALPHQASFSISLIDTVGIHSNEALRRFLNPGYRPAEPEPEPAPSFELDTNAAQNTAQPPEAHDTAHDNPHSTAHDTAHRDVLQDDPAPVLELELELDPEPNAGDLPSAAPPAGAGLESTAAAPPGKGSAAERSAQPGLDRPGQASPAPVAAPPPAPGANDEHTDTRQMNLPIGVWLGFHDGDIPIMAKLAVYDPSRDNYIFVNRQGISLRQISRPELLALVDGGLVDILETQSCFREEVERARGAQR